MKNLPWTEKYRPRLLKDVVGNQDIVERLKILAQKGSMPNLILDGPAGTGKTTSILCLAREIHEDKNYQKAILELNASDSRKVQVVRGTIKTFASKQIALTGNKHKIVILDEADEMTASAQQALRRIMEVYHKTTRFALACNNAKKLIDPIVSKCVTLPYDRIPPEAMTSRLSFIMKEEKVQVDDEKSVLEALMFSSQGDLRKALNILETTWVGNGYVTSDNIYKTVDVPHPIVLQKIVICCSKVQFWEAINLLAPLCAQGYSGLDIIETLLRVIKKSPIRKEYQLTFLSEVGAMQVRVLNGLDSTVQLHGLLAKLCERAKELPK